MSKYLLSIGDSDKYAVEFPGSLDQFKSSSQFKEIKDKVAAFLSEKFPMGGIADIVPIHVEEADGKTEYPQFDLSKLKDLLNSASTQIGVEKFTGKLNLNAPFDQD